MTIPSVPTFSAGETSALTGHLTQVTDCLNWLFAPPHCYAYKSVDGALADSTWGAINFNAELYDWSTVMHDTVTNNSRLLAPETGLYEYKTLVTFQANATGSRSIDVRKNAAGVQTGGTEVATFSALPSAGNVGYCFLSVDVQMTGGTDYLETFARQTSTVSLNVLGGAGSLWASLRFVSKP